MKKGMFFTMDALLATGIIVSAIIILAQFYTYEHKNVNVNYASRDIIELFSTLKANQIDNDYVRSLIAAGNISNPNNSILQQIGEFWAEDKMALALNLAQNVTEDVIPASYGFGFYVDDDLIYSRNLPLNKNLVSSRKIISGIGKLKPTSGYTSRVYLSKITSKTNTVYYPFDITAPCYNSFGFAGNADKASIEYTITLPNDANITNASWIIVPAIATTRVDAYINNNRVFSGIPDENSIINAQGNFTAGVNKVRYNQTVTALGGCPGDDGTSHVILTYKTSQLQTLENKTKFPLAVVYADGRISDYEKPVFAPNLAIEKINITISLNASSVNLSFRLKNQTISLGNKSVINKKVEWNDNEIKNNLTARGISYSDLDNTYFYFIFDFAAKSNNVTIFPNSSVILEGIQKSIPFGSIDVSLPVNLTSQSNPAPFAWCPSSYHNVSYGFNVPARSTHLYADWIIGWCWLADADQIAKANGINLYNHIEGNLATDPFISAFARFGYTSDVSLGSIVAGKNVFDLGFGSDYSTKPSISYGVNVYVIPNSVNYSSVLSKAEGCTWRVQVDQGGNKNISIPKDYIGANACVFNQTDKIYNSNDSTQIAAFEMFKLLDLDEDGDVDLLLSNGDVEINTITQSKVPSLWGPAIVEMRVWD